MQSFQAFCPAKGCIQPGEVCKNTTRQIGNFATHKLAREAQLHHLFSSSNHYLPMHEAEAIDGESCITPYIDPETIVAPVPTRGPRVRSRSRSAASFNARFDTVMGSLVRAEQAALSAERVALAAALTFREEAKVLGEVIVSITPVLR